jgi:hypothetical protein
MPALVAGIHVFTAKTWMAGTSPAMTICLGAQHFIVIAGLVPAIPAISALHIRGYRNISA